MKPANRTEFQRRRIALGLTAQAVADIVGVHIGSVQTWDRGGLKSPEYMPYRTVMRLSALLDVEPEKIVDSMKRDVR